MSALDQITEHEFTCRVVMRSESRAVLSERSLAGWHDFPADVRADDLAVAFFDAIERVSDSSTLEGVRVTADGPHRWLLEVDHVLEPFEVDETTVTMSNGGTATSLRRRYATP